MKVIYFVWPEKKSITWASLINGTSLSRDTQKEVVDQETSTSSLDFAKLKLSLGRVSDYKELFFPLITGTKSGAL